MKVLRLDRLRWARHVNRRPEGSSVLKVTTAEFLDGKRSRGRPKNSWNGCVSNDANVLEIRNWKKLRKDRASAP